jgi:DNA polymerase-3 subunit alpha
VAECKRLGVEILPPDINKSGNDFTIENKTKIRFGLSAIKNVGDAAISNIIEKRNEGDFLSFEDFCKRVDLGTINKKTMESLIKAGAMDNFGKRAKLLINYPEIIEKANRKKKQSSSGQTSLFGEETDELKKEESSPDFSDFSSDEKLAFEKEFLGFYLTSHPQLANLIKLKKDITHEIEAIEEEKEQTSVVIGGIIESTRRIFTKKTGKEMAFFVISNEKGISVECVVFPRTFDQYKSLLTKENVVLVTGKIDSKNDKPVLIADRIKNFSDFSS